MQQTIDPRAIVARHQDFAPVNLDAIARDLGINVYRELLGETISGKIVRDPIAGGHSGFAIYLNKSQHTNRQRFTFAHEISHYILHRDLIESGIVDDVMYRSELSNHFETQANRMAADILMPIKLVRAMYARYPQPGILAKIFGVSEAAMKIRIETVSPNQDDLFG